jgi:alpha-L-rhamnosidase
MYRNIAGINNDPEGPAFQRIIIRPRPWGGLTSASGNFWSVYGMIESSWTLRGPGLTLSVRVPVNATATVYLPTLDVDRVTEGDHPVIGAEGVEFLRFEKGQTVFNLGSGDYRFTMPYHK